MNNLSDEDRCDNARVVLFGKCRLPEASNALQLHVYNELIASQWCGYRQHVKFSFSTTRDNGMVKGQ